MTTPPAPTPETPTWQSAPPPPPPSGPSLRPQLRRSETDKKLGGVCGGLAEYSGIDPLLWRVGFVALTLAGPGVFVYLLLWLLMPSGPAGSDPGPAPLDQLVDRLRYGNSRPGGTGQPGATS